MSGAPGAGASAAGAARQGKGPRALAGAATRSYNVASLWETSAALAEDQLRLVDAVSAWCSVRPIPEDISDDGPTASAASASSEAPAQGQEGYVGTLDSAVLHNVNQFHKWHSELEAACALETEEKYKRYGDLLKSHLQTCESILQKAQHALEVFDTLLGQHKEVAARSRALSSSCEQLVREKDALVEFADAVRTKLKFFDEFEQVSAAFAKAQLSLDSEQLLGLLRKLDDGLAYVESNPQYADAKTYSSKYRQLQVNALSAVRGKVAAVLKAAVAQVQAAVQEAAPRGGHASNGAAGGLLLPEGSEVPLLYVRFRAAAEPNLKGLLREVEARSKQPQHWLLTECQALYCSARQQLLAPLLAHRLSTDVASLPLPSMTRVGCDHLLRACAAEAQLFEQFFPASGAAGALEALAPLTEPLCMLLYDMLRPKVVVQQDIDELCELVDVLRHEVMGDQLSRRGPGAEALRPMLERTLAEVRGRIIYRCQAFIKEAVSSFVPAPEDLDYPGRLERAAQEAAAGGTDGAPGTYSAEQGGPQQADPYQVLYPPLRATLVCLSKLYRAVDGKTFGGLAQEAVAACATSVQAASRQVARRGGVLDAQLFMIRHLLFLREQIAPFDVDFSATGVDLDFTHMRDHMRRILAGDASLFSLSANNAVVKMLGTGGPRVLTYQMDSKKELEKQLKSVCEAFIMAVTKVAVEPLLSFLTKVTAVRAAAAASATAAPGAPPRVQPLREQAFAAPARLAEVVGRVNDALQGPLPAALAKMRLYLPNPSTHAILFKPVKSNIAEAHGQVAALLAAEYTPEEAATIPLKQPQELAEALDALC